MLDEGGAGDAGTQLLRKLGVRSGHVVLVDGAPDGLRLDVLVTETGARAVRRLPRTSSLDVALVFHTDATALGRRLPPVLDRTRTAGAVWVCWPKLSAQRAQGIASDLDEGVVRRIGLDAGWVDVKVAAVDATWSGLRFVRRVADR